ncbi:hypothetical protein K505DRAFT_164297 [Melanomma pulvis-pyrius CBS 109.77]|uniref:Uncharacterized protein n=1 Tax=Melanomma pulvis-pyrius CBS 109.77 TaxID=1314802 RepID=A0A6A6WPG1_9PLEO|nr:hypothetical protein K505DRAFT_164297 [Melanomma pulvis-pyrius CBS 109.77]
MTWVINSAFSVDALYLENCGACGFKGHHARGNLTRHRKTRLLRLIPRHGFISSFLPSSSLYFKYFFFKNFFFIEIHTGNKTFGRAILSFILSFIHSFFLPPLTHPPTYPAYTSP